MGRIITILCLLASGLCQADWQAELTEQLIEEWQQSLGDSLNGRVAISFPGLNQDYQLPDCSHPTDSAWKRPLQPGRNQLILTCESPRWRQHLATRLHQWTAVAILTQPLQSDVLLTKDAVRFVEKDLGDLQQGYFTHWSQLSGQALKRPLRTGTVLTPNMIQGALLINRGDLLVIQIQRRGISLETKGIALAKGRLGQSIKVKNQRSGKVLAATVVSSNRVRVD
jgi:flagella basal body P-ring formation protein FlgA